MRCKVCLYLCSYRCSISYCGACKDIKNVLTFGREGRDDPGGQGAWSMCFVGGLGRGEFGAIGVSPEPWLKIWGWMCRFPWCGNYVYKWRHWSTSDEDDKLLFWRCSICHKMNCCKKWINSSDEKALISKRISTIGVLPVSSIKIIKKGMNTRENYPFLYYFYCIYFFSRFINSEKKCQIIKN